MKTSFRLPWIGLGKQCVHHQAKKMKVCRQPKTGLTSDVESPWVTLSELWVNLWNTLKIIHRHWSKNNNKKMFYMCCVNRCASFNISFTKKQKSKRLRFQVCTYNLDDPISFHWTVLCFWDPTGTILLIFLCSHFHIMKWCFISL